MRIRALIPGLFVLALAGCHGPLENAANHYAHKGETAKLQLKNQTTLYIALDNRDCQPIERAVSARDQETLGKLVREGHAFTVGTGTRVEVLSESFNDRRIKILDGEAEGRTGWVPFEWLKPAS